MKKVGILTFHASYNYGSMLQAFALQQTLKKIGYEPKIINLRTEKQKEIYSYNRKINSFKELIRQILLLPYKKGLSEKKDKFESFLNNYLDCTKEYSTLEQLKEDFFNFDYYIAGSDQIWNTRCSDFDFSYLLPFVRNKKKIAYAPSLGPIKNNYDNLLEYIKDFDCISVREKQNFYSIEQKLGKEIFVALDPTLLLTKNEWFEYIGNENIIKYEYIYIYAPSYRQNILSVAKKLKNKFKVPLIISNIVGYRTLYFGNYVRYFETGPLEFLNLIKNAKVIVSGSFHATLFSMLFEKEVISPNYEKDYRILTLIEKFRNIEEEREKSINFLKEALQ